MARIVTDDEGLRQVVLQSKRIAVLGIKTEAQADQPSFYVAEYLKGQGIEVVPVPVYYPEAKTILGAPVYRTLASVPGELDLVAVFRRPTDLMPHFDDLVAAKPRAVWLQLGIQHDEFAQKLVNAGIDVVQNRCLLVEHKRLAGRQG